MSKFSREKGKRGERELARLFKACGIEAKRGVQYQGGTDSPDVQTAVDWLHVECKRSEALNIYAALEQAAADAGIRLPVVFHKRNGKPWVAVLRAEELLALIREKVNAV